MRIGIMTMHRIDNYGSFLQSLGLKKEVERLGHTTCFVDFKVNRRLSNKKWKNFVQAIKDSLKPIPVNAVYSFDSNCRTYNDILGLTDEWKYRTKVDTLVIGSDEVFNFCQKDFRVGYAPELLGLNNQANKVISYAASSGNLTVNKLGQYGKVKLASKLLKRFSAVSVRDENTGSFVNELTGINPQYHLDPVLVSDFGDIFTDNVSERDYILVYGYPNRFTEAEGTIIKEFAARRGKKLLAFCGRQSFCDKYIECSPLEIFAYFKNADCIITDTFHGTIFSIVNHKQFLTLIREDAQVGYGNAGKVGDLLERLGLIDRRTQLITPIGSEMDAPIDYAAIDAKRMEERKRMREYLEQNL